MRLFKLSTLRLILAGILLTGCGQKGAQGDTAERRGSSEAIAAVRVTADGVNAAEPAIAADSSASLFVVYVEHQPDKSADVFLQKIGAAGRVRVNPEAGTAKAWKGDPPTVAIAADKTIYVGWTRKYADAKEMGSDLMLSVSRDGGGSFDEPVKVNDDSQPASHGMHSLALDAGGNVFMMWLDERALVSQKPKKDESSEDQMAAGTMKHEEAEPNSELYFAASHDGGRTFGRNERVATEVCPCCKTTLLAARDGSVYAGWRQVLPGGFRHIAVSRLDPNAVAFGPAVVVSDDKWQINACPVSGPALGIGSDNRLNVSWYTAGAAGDQGVYSTSSVDGGRTFEPRRLMSKDATSGTPAMVQMNGGLRTIFANLNNGLSAEDVFVPAEEPKPAFQIADASLPAAAGPVGARIPVAFVRHSDERNSIWLSYLPV